MKMKKKYYRDSDGYIWWSDGEECDYSEDFGETWVGEDAWDEKYIKEWGLEEISEEEVFLVFI